MKDVEKGYETVKKKFDDVSGQVMDFAQVFIFF